MWLEEHEQGAEWWEIRSGRKWASDYARSYHGRILRLWLLLMGHGEPLEGFDWKSNFQSKDHAYVLDREWVREEGHS